MRHLRELLLVGSGGPGDRMRHHRRGPAPVPRGTTGTGCPAPGAPRPVATPRAGHGVPAVVAAGTPGHTGLDGPGVGAWVPGRALPERWQRPFRLRLQRPRAVRLRAARHRDAPRRASSVSGGLRDRHRASAARRPAVLQDRVGRGLARGYRNRRRCGSSTPRTRGASCASIGCPRPTGPRVCSARAASNSPRARPARAARPAPRAPRPPARTAVREPDRGRRPGAAVPHHPCATG